MLLSIVIINYNTFELTCGCIRSIVETTQLPYEIILVDNNSRECDPQRFCEAFPGLKLIALKENVGFGRANNRGVAEARGKYVLLLNSDTLVHEGTLDRSVACLERNPQIDILGCKVLYSDRTVQPTVVKDEREYNVLSAIRFLIKRNTLFVETRLLLQNKRAKNKSAASAPTDAPDRQVKAEQPDLVPNYHNGCRIGSLIGVFLLLKRNVYEASKGFDPDFFMYYEEIEWFVKRLRNYNIVYFPHATITHYQGGSNVYKKMNEQFWLSQHLFWYKMGRVHYLIYFLFNLIDIPSRLLVAWLLKRHRPSHDVPAMLKALGNFVTVLQYPNRYGGRRHTLKLPYLKKNDL